MKKQFTLLLTAVLILMGSGAFAQQADSATIKAWKDYVTPGEMQKRLAAFNGKWTVEISVWMDTSSTPRTTTGTSENKMIMGGRYQESTYSATVLGMPFEGRATTGYDNALKKYQTVWIDNMGTGIMMTEGAYDPKSKTLEMMGKSVDPVTGEETKVRQTMQFTDANHRIMEMYTVLPDGTERKTMEVKYTKIK